MRARSIKPGICDNEVLGTADLLYTVLFERLWMMADREGRLEDRPLRIKAQAFPYRDGLDVGPALAWLHQHGFIQRYGVGEARYIQVLKFSQHQSPHIKEAPSTIPAPDSPGARTDPAPDKKSAEPVLAPEIPAPAALTPSSLTPDSGLLTPDSNSPLRGAPVRRKRTRTDVDEVFDHWRQEHGHLNARLDSKRRARIVEGLKAFTAEQLRNAISGYRHSPHHTGTDPRGNGVKYDDIELLLRDAKRIEAGLQFFAHPPRPPPKPETATERMLRTLNGSDDSRVIDHDDERELPAISRQ